MMSWHLQTLSVGPLFTNAYLLHATDPQECDEAILVDPGGDADLLLQAIDTSGCRLHMMLATHGHFDHIAAAEAIQREHDVPLLLHPEDVQMVEHMPQIQASYGFPQSAIPRFEASLANGQQLSFAGGELTVTHIPGHCPGHVMFTWADRCLVGDCIFEGSVGRTDLPGGSFPVMEKSIREHIYMLPDATILYPGHGGETTVGREKETNPFVNLRGGF